MRDYLKIDKIIKKGNRIDYSYVLEGKWNELLKSEIKMFVEYDINIENVPDSIAVIPLLCNLLPISWVFDVDIFVDSIDENFYNCISDVKKGYINMYPEIKMLGNLNVNKIENNQQEVCGAGVFFSGGVDAFNTLICHTEEKPTLITVWGSDIAINNVEGWKKVSEHTEHVASEFKLKHSFIKANFRDFINYRELSQYIKRFINGEWWHEFQHGIGLLGLGAPLAYEEKFQVLYIASSFSAEVKGMYTCASDPTIDNYLKFSNCKIIHDGYEFNRQNKLKNICEFVNVNKVDSILLRVCWKSSSGKNCCECEKCYRTIIGIIAEKNYPDNFGLELSLQKRRKMMKKLKGIVKYDKLRYNSIKKAFLENYSESETPKDLIWFRNVKFKSKKPNYIIYYERLKSYLQRVINKLSKK